MSVIRALFGLTVTLLSVLAVIVLIFVLIKIGLRFHVSDGPYMIYQLEQRVNAMISGGPLEEISPWLEIHMKLAEIPKLTAVDALVNAFGLFCFGILVFIFILLFAIITIAALVQGLFTADWNVIMAFIISVIMLPVAVIAGSIALLFLWAQFFFHNVTPGYCLVWLIVGIPALIIGAGVGATASASPWIVLFRSANLLVLRRD